MTSGILRKTQRQLGFGVGISPFSEAHEDYGTVDPTRPILRVLASQARCDGQSGFRLVKLVGENVKLVNECREGSRVESLG